MRRPPAPAREEAPEEELARPCLEAVEPATADPQRDDARPFRDDVDDAEPVAKSREGGRDDAVREEQPEGGEIEAAPVVGGDAVEHELVPRRDLVEPGKRDPRVRGEVNRVPGLVAQTAAHDHDRADDHGDQQPGADRGGDHARVDAAADHRRELARKRDPVEERVAPDRQDDVR
jgi:hypothetical protein